MKGILTTADKILMIALLALAGAGILAGWHFAAGTGRQAAQIIVDGKVVRTVTLEAGYKQRFQAAPDRNVWIEEDGARIRIAASDCPDQICVRTGWIERAPQQTVCLPNRVMIKIITPSAGDVDAITG